MIHYLNGYLLFPLLEKLTERQIRPKLEQLRAFEKLSGIEQQLQQREKLYHLLFFCEQNIPYYTDLFKAHAFTVEKVKKDIRYFHDLPVLTKELVRDNSERLKARNRGHLHVRKTGGSTGQSVFFYYDNDGLDWTSAINLYAYEMAGKKPHHSDCHISADLDLGTPILKDKLKDFIKLFSQNRKRLLISSFSDEDLAKNYKELKKIRPYLLQGHPSSLYALANFIEKKGLKPRKLCEVFEPTGEMLTDKMVTTIEKNILCKVVNRYGNAEFGVVAHSIQGDGYNKLKIFQSAFYVEPCHESNILVTCLTNYGFPLLRYDTGDVASVSNEENKAYITEIQGRIHDIIYVGPDKFPTHYIMDFLDHQVRGVREFQIVLSDKSKPLMNIVPENVEDFTRIQEAIEKRWPSGFEINLASFESLVKQGWRQKFRHLIDLREKA